VFINFEDGKVTASEADSMLAIEKMVKTPKNKIIQH
jgi:hypothetical protein